MADNATTELKWEVVEHWLENWSDPKNAKWSGSNCAFCREFSCGDDDAIAGNESCLGCPIRELTGMDGCSGSPWEDVQEAQLKAQRLPTCLHTLEAKDAMEKEYRFLVHIALGELDEARAMCKLNFEDTIEEGEEDEFDD